jgi:hypothetical protein
MQALELFNSNHDHYGTPVLLNSDGLGASCIDETTEPVLGISRRHPPHIHLPAASHNSHNVHWRQRAVLAGLTGDAALIGKGKDTHLML